MSRSTTSAVSDLLREPGVQAAIFDHFVILARAFAEVLQANNNTAKTQLDGHLAQGTATRISFTLDGYGPENF